MNRKRSPQSLPGRAALVCAVAFMLFTIPTLAQQTLPELRMLSPHSHRQPPLSRLRDQLHQHAEAVLRNSLSCCGYAIKPH